MSANPETIYGRKGGNYNVLDPSERYSEKRVQGLHAKTGEPVANPFTGTLTELPSQRDHAKAGVFLKHLASRSGLVHCTLDDAERDLLAEIATKEAWAGVADGDYHSRLPGGGYVKALLDDATSGGLEITPIAFDDSIVTFPLLHGELFPHVDVRDLPRGRRVEGGSVGNPTISWGEGDNSEVSLFNTADLVGALDSTVFGCAVAVEVGRDFLSDAAVDVGAILTANIGQAVQADLDKKIANGNGTSEPEGIFTASGISTVTPDNTTTGPPTLADYLDLLFGIDKQYRNRGFRPTFISNDTSFQRSRAINVDTATPTTDQRPVMAPLTQVNDYTTLGWPHAIQNDIANGRAAFGALAKYRLYRRAGLEIRFVDGGKELARKNLVLLVARARFAGRVMDTDAFVKWTAGQS
jgi:HK97 family phage major capsid protein